MNNLYNVEAALMNMLIICCVFHPPALPQTLRLNFSPSRYRGAMLRAAAPKNKTRPMGLSLAMMGYTQIPATWCTQRTLESGENNQMVKGATVLSAPPWSTIITPHTHDYLWLWLQANLSCLTMTNKVQRREPSLGCLSPCCHIYDSECTSVQTAVVRW